MSDLIKRDDALHIVDVAEDEHPYKVPGLFVTYSEYNQGWSDAVDFIRSRMEKADSVPASPWHRVEEPPKQAGEYIVAYHPCYWDDVDTKATRVGIDNFRGKSAWAKKKFQRVTHWMEKPEPPKEDA